MEKKRYTVFGGYIVKGYSSSLLFFCFVQVLGY